MIPQTQMLWSTEEQMLPRRWNNKRPALTNCPDLLQKLRGLILKKAQQRLSQGTLQRHLYLKRLFRHFLERTLLQPTTTTLTLFLEWMAHGISASTTLQYARTMRSLFPLLQGQELTHYIQGLQVLTARTPIKQSKTLEPQDITQILTLAPSPDPRYPLWLMAKSCSRWDEISQLTKETVRLISPTQILLEFSYKTKASKTTPFRPDMFVIVEAPQEYVTTIATWVTSLRKGQRITRWTTKQITKFFQDTLQDKSMTSRSIKRTGLQHLCQQAADGKIPPQLVSFLGKHLGAQQPLSQTTVRYITDKSAIALASGTHLATRLLQVHLPL